MFLRMPTAQSAPHPYRARAGPRQEVFCFACWGCGKSKNKKGRGAEVKLIIFNIVRPVTLGANLTKGPVCSGVRRIYNPCRRVQPTPSAPIDVFGSAVVAGTARTALGGNWSSVWRSNCPQTSANPVVEIADSCQIRLP